MKHPTTESIGANCIRKPACLKPENNKIIASPALINTHFSLIANTGTTEPAMLYTIIDTYRVENATMNNRRGNWFIKSAPKNNELFNNTHKE